MVIICKIRPIVDETKREIVSRLRRPFTAVCRSSFASSGSWMMLLNHFIVRRPRERNFKRNPRRMNTAMAAGMMEITGRKHV